MACAAANMQKTSGGAATAFRQPSLANLGALFLPQDVDSRVALALRHSTTRPETVSVKANDKQQQYKVEKAAG